MMYRSFVAAQAAAIKADAYPFTATVVDARYGVRTITFTTADDYTSEKTVVLVLTDHTDVYTIDTRENIAATLWELTSVDEYLVESVAKGRWDQTTYRLLAEAGFDLRPATIEECFQ